MRDIQLVDLKGQYDRIQEEIDEVVLNVIRSTAYINGPEVTKFQENFGNHLNVKHVIPCANGTDALQVALMALGLEPGDEVITPSFTYIATAEVISLLRLKPVFVEVDPDTFLIDPDAFAKAVTPKTKAVIPVHLYGQCADMEKIMQIANANGIAVIEDTAQAIGAEYINRNGERKKAGSIGTVGCTSFFPSKNLGCYGDGGAIMTNDDKLNEKIRMIANHGQKKRYYHDITGVNSRLDSIQAAILNVKLRYLDDYVKARNQVADHYDQEFEGLDTLKTPVRAKHSTHAFHQYTVKLDGLNREELQQYLKDKNIPSNVYYPLPIHLQKAFQDSGYKKGDLPVTEELCEKVLSFPVHTEMDQEQLNHISDAVKSFAAVEKEKI